MDGEVLLSMTMDDLKDDFKMKVGPRKKLLQKIQALKAMAEEMKKSKLTLVNLK